MNDPVGGTGHTDSRTDSRADSRADSHGDAEVDTRSHAGSAIYGGVPR